MLPRPSLLGKSAAIDGKFSEVTHLTINGDRAAVLLDGDVVADREAKPGALPGRFGRKERLKEFVLEAIAEEVETEAGDAWGTISIGAMPSAKSRSSEMLKL
jgi:hypothetical protein